MFDLEQLTQVCYESGDEGVPWSMNRSFGIPIWLNRSISARAMFFEVIVAERDGLWVSYGNSQRSPGYTNGHGWTLANCCKDVKSMLPNDSIQEFREK